MREMFVYYCGTVLVLTSLYKFCWTYINVWNTRVYSVWFINYTDSITYFGYRQQEFQRNITLEKEKIRFIKLKLFLFV